jgi:hypothetical protein
MAQAMPMQKSLLGGAALSALRSTSKVSDGFSRWGVFYYLSG